MPDRRFAVPNPPAPDHTLDADEANVHHARDNSLDPVATVEPGEVVEFDCRDAYDRQLSPGATVADLLAVETAGHSLAGPVAVEGATPGDVLRVDLLGFEHEGWGVSAVPPGEREGDLLPDEPLDAHVRMGPRRGGRRDAGRPLRRGRRARRLGSLPPVPGEPRGRPRRGRAARHDAPALRRGNVDVKHLTAGATLYLPVDEGALFSVGDCHAAQGDGEVCITGIEVARNGEAVS